MHRRKNIRLTGYNYADSALYFITVCVQHRMCLFGKIVNENMILNDAGRMIEKWYMELENKYPDKKCHEMVVMPNHFHCIIENRATHVLDVDDMNTDAHVGASLRGRPLRGRPLRGCNNMRNPQPYGHDNKKCGATIGDAMDWFKTMTTNEYIRGVKNNNWKRFDRRMWQRNYYDHIIRNQQSYENISYYIKNNPKNWDKDKFNQ